MRKILIVIVVVVLLVGGVFALAVLNVNGLLEEKRYELAQMASEAMGREVRFEKAEVAFPGRLSIEITGLRIAEDPRFGKADFLALDSAYISVDLWPALERRLQLTGVVLDGPTIRVIQTKQGFNFSSLGAAKEKTNEGAEEDAKEAPAPPPADESGSMALAIAGFRIEKGTIFFEDRTANPPLALTIEDFESSGSDISPNNPVEISFSGLLRPTKGDARIASRIQGKIDVTDLSGGAVKIQLESPSFHPLLFGVELEEGGPVERLDDLEVNVALPVDAAKSGYPIQLRSSAGRLGGFDFKTLDTALLFRDSKLDIQRFVVGIAGGNVGLTGELTLGASGRAPFKLDTKLTDLDSGELASILLDVPKGMVTGLLGGDIDLSGDSLEWKTLKRSLAGQIRLEVGKGALEEVNLLDGIVNRLLQDPGLGRLAANSIRDIAPKSLQGNRTVFENVNLAFDIANGALNAKDIELRTGDFVLSAVGALGFDGGVSGKGKIRLSQQLSRKILKKADSLAPLLGHSEFVELPILLGGTTNSMKLQPDLAALTATARSNATKELRQEAGRKLSDAIFGKRKKRAQGQEPSQKDLDREAAESLIDRGLGQFLGK